MRINKYIATSGVASRRAAEELILNERVKLNGKVVSDLATTVGKRDIVTVDEKLIQPIKEMVYVMLNKPKGCVTTVKDSRDRKTVMDYLEPLKSYRVFPIGRLDYNTEGLLLITNDGQLCNRLTHPSNEVPKTYIAKVTGKLNADELAKLQRGIELDGIKLQRCKIRLLEHLDNVSRYEITIREGRNRQIHRMFESVDKEIIFLKRIAVGSLKLGGLARGQFRYLSNSEVDYLKRV